jgi:Raf kinase inhibitor-like YbhB/YbcL family protein
MQLLSPDFSNQQMVPVKCTCKGDNTSPALSITDIPQTAKSLALVVHDPDAPGGNFTHWLVWNIAPNTAQLEANAVPAQAVQGMNSASVTGYMGPCPPSGTHRYIFSLYALDTMLDLPETTNQAPLLDEIAKHTIERTELVGLFAA